METMHIVVEAIDGGGKGVVARGIASYFRSQGREVREIAEPTSLGLGKFIREELIAKHEDGRTYTGRTAAIAYAMDREQLYLESAIPFLRNGKDRVLVQDRSVLSSLVYQPAQDPSVTLEWLLSLEGNKLELANAPNVLVILRVDADVAMQRLAKRTDKHDNSVFERTDLQKIFAERYRDPVLLAPFKERGTHIVEVDSGQEPEDVIRDAIRAIEPFL